MKNKPYLISTLITFIILALVPKSFAQNTTPEYVVRTIYFIPNDREANPDIDTQLDTIMKEVQLFYADQMEKHGFGRKTFALETDESGKIVIHSVIGEFNEEYYHNNFWSVSEVIRNFDSSKNINVILVDTDTNFGGYANSGISGGNAVIALAAIDGIGVMTHELGHVFGLSHDWRNNSYMMSYGQYPNAMSACAAEWLDVHKYFNTTHRTFNDNTKIQMLNTDIVTSPHTIRLTFEITDPDLLHQAQLILPYNTDSERSEIGISMIDCKSLNKQEHIIIEFVTTKLLTINTGVIYLNVIDSQGNIKSSPFQIDITSQLPVSEPIIIPDKNLENVVRDTLGLADNIPITQLNILKLTKLVVYNNLNIHDLTGLEHATHLHRLTIDNNPIQDMTPIVNLKQLKSVSLSYNQINNIPSLTEMKELTSLSLQGTHISDITPLSHLTQLTTLHISGQRINIDKLFSVLTELAILRELTLFDMKISDITPLAALTNLRNLGLSRNQISDITPLAALTHLRRLDITDNQIRDITPINKLIQLRQLFLDRNQIHDVETLAELKNLSELGLIENPIKDREPLLALLRKNPDVKIYLKNYDDPLPVTLSHFRAEQTEAGVVLKWITESELDNAGFYIYRSETKSGEFKVVNPTMIQGAGTTGERTEYNWTDTTAEPNTVYYYRIEDVSHAGVREQLATVRLRGLVSASGKLMTSWADIKEFQ